MYCGLMIYLEVPELNRHDYQTLNSLIEFPKKVNQGPKYK